jgi:hypothetical protein
MNPNGGFAKFLRVVGIIFMSLATLFNLMGGTGSSCIAFFAETYGPDYANIVPYKWLYQLLVVLTTAAAVYGIYAIVQLIKGTKRAWRDTVIALSVALVLTVIQIVASRTLRGKSMPNDMRLYITVITLLLFLIFRIPKVWQGVNFDKGARKGGGRLAGSLALILGGLFTILSPAMFAGTHTINGTNYAAAWQWQFLLVGGAMLVAGGSYLVRLLRPPAVRSAVFLAGESKA